MKIIKNIFLTFFLLLSVATIIKNFLLQPHQYKLIESNDSLVDNAQTVEGIKKLESVSADTSFDYRVWEENLNKLIKTNSVDSDEIVRVKSEYEVLSQKHASLSSLADQQLRDVRELLLAREFVELIDAKVQSALAQLDRTQEEIVKIEKDLFLVTSALIDLVNAQLVAYVESEFKN